MPGLIVKNRYRKATAKTSGGHLGNLVHYVATRDGVEKPLGREHYLDYIANRPRVEKVDGHGLFNGGNSPIVLSKVANEIATHSGNVWTPILSLSREDAHATGYENADAWKALLSSKVFALAESFKIHPDNFRWYAAFHNEAHHPHVHLICYSTNPNEGYLTTHGIEKMKSSLATEIFKQQLQPLYVQKTQRRDELKCEAKQAVLDLPFQDAANPQLENLMFQLSEKLKTVEGKKQYGYLRPPMKKLVDTVVDEIAKLPAVEKAYSLWQEMQDEIVHGYQDMVPKRLPLSRQKEFRSIKNMVIQEVLKLDLEFAMQGIAGERMNENTVSATQGLQEITHNPDLGQSVFRLLGSVSKLFEDNVQKSFSQDRADSKSIRKLCEKKRLHGQKHTGEDASFTQKY